MRRELLAGRGGPRAQLIGALAGGVSRGAQPGGGRPGEAS